MRRVFKKVIVYLGITMALIILVFIILTKITYKPVVYLTNKGFDNSKKEIIFPRVENFEEKLSKVEVKKDIVYPSEYGNNNLDLILPKDVKNPPIILWVHGGAFVGGDKNDSLDYLITLASNGYAIANINYDLSPRISYPAPVNQITEAYNYIKGIEYEYKLDLSKVFIGGDSAGAQIAGQFINIQMNDEYSNKVNIKSCIEDENIKGFISFSGLLNMEEFNETDSWLSNLLFDHAAWAYFKDRKWEDNPLVKESSVIGNIDKFPPTFITDGNVDSFENQAKELCNDLKELKIPVELNLYDKDKTQLVHEYQFNMELEEARDNFEKVVAFLEKYKK